MNVNKINKLVRYTLMSTLFAGVFSSNADAKTANKPNIKESSHAVTTKIAYVYLGRIMTIDSNALPKASTEWKDMFDKLQQSLEPVNAELQKLEERFKKGRTEFESLQKSGLSSREALQRKAEEMAKLEYELRQSMQEREEFAQRELNRMQSVIAPKVETILKKIKEDQGWDAIERGENLLLVTPKFDLTQQVLDQLNKQYAAEQEAKKKEEQKKASEITAP